MHGGGERLSDIIFNSNSKYFSIRLCSIYRLKVLKGTGHLSERKTHLCVRNCLCKQEVPIFLKLNHL